jgi:hypothetical protein
VATVAKSSATLRITGDALDPTAISILLGHAPTVAHSKGEELVGKVSGTRRVAKFGIWRLEAGDRVPADLDAQIRELLSRLTADLAVWKHISSAYSVDLFCGLFLESGNEGISLSPWSLEQLAARRIEVGFDIYGSGE